MLNKLKYNDLIFIDIETVREVDKIDELSDYKAELFLKKFRNNNNKDVSDQDLWVENASLYPEFSKIVAISLVAPHKNEFLSYSYKSENEVELLNLFITKFSKVLNLATDKILCGYNIQDFDFPFIAKRCLINGIAIPPSFDYSESKPWEVNHLNDLFKVYSYGNYKNSVSLKLLANVLLGHEYSITGDKVSEIYYNKKSDNLDVISNYCDEDVIILAKCYAKILNEDISNYKIVKK